ncbi:hypothetical protein ACWC24_21630 [Streptomyces sp. NPDC001443]
MIVVAVLLLPLLSALLIVMDRVEDHMLRPADARRRHAGGRRHLRLVRGGRRDAQENPEQPAPEGSGTAPAARAA